MTAEATSAPSQSNICSVVWSGAVLSSANFTGIARDSPRGRPTLLELGARELLVHGLGPQPGIAGRQFLERQIEDLRKRGGGGWPYVVDRHRPPQFARDRGELVAVEAARGDPVGERRGVEV